MKFIADTHSSTLDSPYEFYLSNYFALQYMNYNLTINLCLFLSGTCAAVKVPNKFSDLQFQSVETQCYYINLRST